MSLVRSVGLSSLSLCSLLAVVRLVAGLLHTSHTVSPTVCLQYKILTSYEISWSSQEGRETVALGVCDL